MTRTQRTLIVAGAVAAIVIAANASQGAYFSQSWGWVALAFLVPTTLLLILDRVSVPGRLRILFATFMGALGLWIALSTAWSISTSASVREVERMLVYVALALAVALVLRRGDGPGVFAGTVVGITVISSYGLATRLFPDRFDTVEDPFNAYRLAEPLGYWNAFALLSAIGAILALGVVAHARRAWHAVAAGAVVPILVTALYFAFSRGSWGALFVGLAATVALDPRRISFIWSLLALAPATVVAVAVASRQEALTTENAEDALLARATQEGHQVAWVLAALVVCSAAMAWAAHLIARRVRATARVRRGVAVVLAVGAAATGIAVVMAAGGPLSAFDELRDRFEAPVAGGETLNDRLFSVSGNGRQETIRVAWDTGSERPLAGTGAGTFEIVWYERRPSGQIVRDAHSLYAETFSELGLVGLALLGAALLVPFVAAVRARRTRYVAPAFGAYLAWAAASGLDWHWEMVGLTATALFAGSVGLVSAERRQRGLVHAGSRLALVGVTATLSVLAVWSLVGNQALFAAREALVREEWSEARTHARRAEQLLPWSYEPELALGSAAAGAGDRDGARAAYSDAVATDPRRWIAWLQLAQVARGAEKRAAYDRVRQLNPRQEALPGE